MANEKQSGNFRWFKFVFPAYMIAWFVAYIYWRIPKWVMMVGFIGGSLLLTLLFGVLFTRRSRTRLADVNRSYQLLLESVAAMSVGELILPVDRILADPQKFAVTPGEALPEAQAAKLPPVAREFFTRYATVKSTVLSLELSRALLDAPAPDGFMRIGTEEENQADIFLVTGSEQVAVRGRSTEHVYTVDFATIYHYLYATDRINQWAEGKCMTESSGV